MSDRSAPFNPWSVAPVCIYAVFVSVVSWATTMALVGVFAQDWPQRIHRLASPYFLGCEVLVFVSSVAMALAYGQKIHPHRLKSSDILYGGRYKMLVPTTYGFVSKSILAVRTALIPMTFLYLVFGVRPQDTMLHDLTQYHPLLNWLFP